MHSTRNAANGGWNVRRAKMHGMEEFRGSGVAGHLQIATPLTDAAGLRWRSRNSGRSEAELGSSVWI
jgi:hypothetical protein